jgi:site-specific DNA recombinase
MVTGSTRNTTGTNIDLAPFYAHDVPMTAAGESTSALLVALYGRQSRNKKTSVDQQLDTGRGDAADEGWAIFGEYQDGVSASRFSKKVREDWARLLSDLGAKKFDVLWLWESSRGDRDIVSWVTMLDQCRALDVKIFVHTHDRLYDVRNARDWKALVEDGTDSAYEVEKTSLRVLRDTDARAKDGRPHGFAAFGYRREVILNETRELVGTKEVLVPEQADVIYSAAQSLLGGESLRSIVARLNREGAPTPRGNPWNSTTLRQMLLRERNAGLRRHRGKVVGNGNWDPIYDEDTHTRVVTILRDPQRKTNRGAEIKHLVSCIALCGREECDGTMRVNAARKAYGGRPNPHPIGYQCGTCMRVRRKQTLVDEVVERVMIARLERPDALDKLATGDPDRLGELREIIAGLEARLLHYADQAADNEITDQQLARINAKLRPQLAAAEAEMESCHPNPGILKLAGPDAAAKWKAAPLDLKRAVIKAMTVVTILPIGSGAKVTPESIRIQWRTADGRLIDAA